MSKRILVSFLGGGLALNSEHRKEYRSGTYRFPDSTDQTGKFFGLELASWLESIGQKVDNAVVVGTPTSMWDLLAEEASPHNPGLEPLMLDLADLCCPAGEGASEDQLLDLSHKLSGTRGVPSWSCVRVPNGITESEQLQILEQIAATIPDQAELSIDVTHGYRSSAMLGLLLGQFLQSTRGVTVERIVYGAFEMGAHGEPAPVVEMHGLLRLQKWSDALAAFKDSGTLSPFVPLLEADGAHLNGQVKKLREISLAERSNNLHRVRESRVHVSNGIKQDPPAQGTLSAMFTPTLELAVRPYPQQLSQAQRKRAQHFLSHDDLLQATILCHEGLISRAVEKEGTDAWTADYDVRKRIAEDSKGDRCQDEALLASLRNSLAHGTSANWSKAEELRRNPKKLATFLNEILRRGDLWD